MDDKAIGTIKKICESNKEKFGKGLDGSNIFSIFHIEAMEIRHSNFLEYLFDNVKNGSIKNHFINWFIDKTVDNSELKKDFKNAVKNKTYEVKREHKNMDLMIVFKEIGIIVIENKINAPESKGQLDKYWKRAFDEAKAMNKDSSSIVFVFLTPDGKAPEDDSYKAWKQMSYKSIKDKVKDLKKNIKEGKNAILLEDYSEVLKKVVNKKEKKRNEEYENYKDCKKEGLEEEIKGIAKYVPDTGIRELIIEQFFETKKDIEREHQGRSTYINYHPKDWEIQYNEGTVLGVIVFTNRGSGITLGVNLEWDDDCCKDKAFDIQEEFIKNSNIKYDLDNTGNVNNKGNQNFCSLGLKMRPLLNDKNKKTEAEKNRDLIKKLDEFFSNDGDYNKLCDFFDACKKQ